MEKKPKIVYEHMAFKLKMPTSQVPYIIYDCIELGDKYKKCRFQCLVDSNTYTIFETKEELFKTYPHVNF